MEEFIESFTTFRDWLNSLSSKDVWGEEYDDNIAVGFNACVEHVKEKFNELGLNSAF